MAEIRYYDRARGTWAFERVFGEQELRALYGSPLRAALTDRLLARGPFSALHGGRNRLPGSKAGIPEFVSRLGIDPSEAERPLHDYPSLDAFFARRLKPGARPLDPDPQALLSPCDARTLCWDAWPRGAALRIKQSEVELPALVCDPALSERFAGGPTAVFRLAPADYHRFHFPASGWAHPPRPIPGRLHSVHPIALASGVPSLLNKRSTTLLELDPTGTLLLVEVGALTVGTIEQTYRPGRVTRGAEKGTFHFGGSTLVLLAEPGQIRFDPDLLQRSATGEETLVRMGTRIGELAAR